MSHTKSSITLTDAIRLFTLDNQARRFTAPTMEFYRYRLRTFVRWCDGQGVDKLDDVTTNLLRAYLAYLHEQGYASITVHAAARVLRRFLRFCAEEKLIPEPPKLVMPSVDKRVMPSLSHDEVKRLLTACRTVRETAVVLFLLDTGVRASELVSLDGDHLHMDAGEVAVVGGKGRKDRTVFVGAKTKRALLRYFIQAGTPKSGQALFRSDNTGDRLTRNGLQQLLGRLGERAQVEHCNAHTFRRTFALWSLRNGMNIYALQRLMGHSDLTTMLSYLGLQKEDLRDAHEQYGPVDRML